MVSLYMGGLERTTGVVILGTILSFLLLLETLRLNLPKFNDFAVRMWKPIMRKNELNRLSGLPFYVGAAVLAIGIFPKTIAVLCLLYLAVGDPVASLFGILYGHKGKRFANGKSMAGTIAGISACFVVSLIVLSGASLSPEKVLLLSTIGAFAGGTVELLPLDMDDNFTIPVISGFVMWLAFILVA